MKIDASKIKQFRTQRNWSQEQLSEKSNLSLRTIQRIETTQFASRESIKLIAKAFDVEVDTLMLHEHQSYIKPIQSIKNSFMEFSNFSGKASRYDYWCFLIFVILCLAIATIIHDKLYQIVGLLLIIPLLAIGNRRLNDTGHSAWWQIFLFVPFGQIVVFYMMSLPQNDVDSNSK